jgi:HEAT repeat protein/S1-C subfamily serine protease
VAHPRPAARPAKPLPLDDEPDELGELGEPDEPRLIRTPVRQQSGGSAGVLIVVGVVALLVAGGGITAAVIYLNSDKPETTTETKPEPKPDPKPAPKPTPNEEPTVEPKPKVVYPKLPPEPAGIAPLQSADTINQRLLKSTAVLFPHGQAGHGTGIVVHARRRLVLTTDHVVQDARAVTVMFPAYSNNVPIPDLDYYTRRSANGIVGRVVARDVRRNLALLELEAIPPSARPVWFARTSAAVDSSVHWVGATDDFRPQLWQKSFGTVRFHGKRREKYSRGTLDTTILETDPVANPGESGGALVNDRGELVALVGQYQLNLQPLSRNVDVNEVRAFLEEYFKSRVVDEEWSDPKAPGSAGSDLPNLNALIDVVKRGAPADRLAAARRLGNLEAAARPAVPALLTVMETADPELEASIGAALERIGPPEPGAESILVPAIRSKSPVARGYALRTLAAGPGIPEDAIPQLVAALDDPFAEVRAGAAALLGRVGEKARPTALGPLLDRAADADPTVRTAAADAVPKLGKPGPQDKPVLLKKLADPDARVRLAAAVAIAPLTDADAELAAEIWVPLLKDPTPALRVTALRGLLKHPDRLPRLAADVLPLLDDEDKSVRAAAILAAGHMKGRPGLPQRVARAFEKETDPEVKAAAAEAIVNLTEPNASDVEPLRKILVGGPPKARQAAADKLAQLGPGAAPAIDDLIDRAKSDADPAVRVAALRALAATGAEGRKSLPLAAELFNAADTPEAVRNAAIAVLGQGGPEGLKVLKDAANKPSLPTSTKIEICRAFAAAGPDAQDMHEWMISLAETTPKCREAVAQALAKHGNDKSVQLLLKRTEVYKPSKVGEPPETYPTDYRRWAVETLGQMNLKEVATKDTRERVATRMKDLERDSDPDVARAAAAVRKNLP